MESKLDLLQIKDRDRKLEAFERLLKTMEELRALCPWDQKQTWESLSVLTVEEVYELVDAIAEGQAADVEEELGDILLHMVFYAKIAEEKRQFDIASSIHKLCDKLVERHPHVYGDLKVESEAEVKKNWEQIKLQSGKKSVLQGVPKALPALVKAYRMQQKTAQVGFEWDKKSEVWDKVKEELYEFESAENTADKEAEFGDLLFALVNYARYEGIDPEAALSKTNKKFKNRFEYIEKHAPKDLNDMSLSEMDVLWEEAKREE